ncbi:hypothetical protein AB4Y40_34280 [Paraburkholderia sp. EG287B]|uniref:hypothetical protein n=1 Tax=Paraburkholderia sp. EG287B TaxID=3237010 RepID=UPI0034D2A40F
MLSAVRRALDLISEKRGEVFELQDIPAEDPATYEMICRADTIVNSPNRSSRRSRASESMAFLKAIPRASR